MKRIATLLLIAAFPGCGNTPTLNSTATGLNPGIYTGDIVCEGTITEATGTVPFQDVYAGRRVIGESGLPVQDGVEVREGDVVELEFGGLTASGVIDAVTVTANGVVVDSSGSFISDVCTDTNCTSVEMISSESLKASGQTSIEVSSATTILASIDGQNGSGWAVCTGVLSQ
jgi:hypothetical protein